MIQNIKRYKRFSSIKSIEQEVDKEIIQMVELNYAYLKHTPSINSVFGLDLNSSNRASIGQAGYQDDFNIYEVGRQLSQCYNLKLLELNLQERNVSINSLEIFFSYVSRCSLLDTLIFNLSYNNLDIEIFSLLTKYLACFKDLKSLNLIFSFCQFNCIEEEDRESELRRYLLACTQLERISISFSYCSLGEKGIKKVSVGSPNCTNVHELKLMLSGNRMGDEGLVGLSEQIFKFENLQSLCLYLNQNFIGDLGIIHLSQSIKNLSQLKYLYLSLSFNNIGDEGILHLSKSLLNSKCLIDFYLNLLYCNTLKEDLLCFFKDLAEVKSMRQLAVKFNTEKKEVKFHQKPLQYLKKKNPRLVILEFHV